MSSKLVGGLSQEPRLDGKVAIVSGASRGIGQAIAIRFIEEGAKGVVLVDILPCNDTIDIITSIPGLEIDVAFKRTLYVSCDISNEDDVKNLYDKVNHHFGPEIHILVNNAAKFVFASIEDATAEDWDRTCKVNIKGHALMTKYAIPFMKRAGSGSIVFQGSISSFKSQPNTVPYSTVKAALVQMSRNSAYDLGKYNIRVNSVCPGTIETPVSKLDRQQHGWTHEQWEQIKTKDTIYCTGTELHVDGGQINCTVMD